MPLTLEEMVSVYYNVQEAMWDHYEEGCRDYPTLACVLHKPEERLTIDQWRERIINDDLSSRHFRIPGASYRSFKRRT